MGFAQTIQSGAERLAKSIGETIGRAAVSTTDGASRLTQSLAAGLASGETLEKARRGLADKPPARSQGSGPLGGLTLPGQGEGVVEWDPDRWYTTPPEHLHTPGMLNRLTYDMLRQTARHPLVASIINTRQNEVRMFTRRRPSKTSTGFAIEVRDVDRSPTAAEKKRAEELTQVIERCGNWPDATIIGTPERPNFAQFGNMWVRDSLTYDQACPEIVFDRLGARPAAFRMLPSHTIRRAKYGGKNVAALGLPGDSDAAYIQMYRQERLAAFDERQIAWCVRRQRSDIEACGYGWPEFEEAVDVVTYLLWNMQYNAGQFKQGMMGQGILSIIGDKMHPDKWSSFKREFRAMMTGVTNAGRYALMNIEDPQGKVHWEDFGRTNKEMEFSQWMAFLLKVLCAVFQIDPAQLGFVYGTEGQTSAMQSQGPGERVQLSKDKGLFPLLVTLEWCINTWFLWPLAPEFAFRFHGLEVESEMDRARLDQIRVQTYARVDEIRAEHDMAPMPDGKGALILNSVYLQAAQAADAPPEGEGGPGAPGGPEGGDGGEGQDDDEDAGAFPGLSLPGGKGGAKGNASPDDDEADDDDEPVRKALAPARPVRRRVYSVEW